MPRPLHRARLATFVCALAVLAAACGADTDEPSAAGGGDIIEDPTDQGTDGEDAGGTTMRVYSVSEAKALEQEGSVHVSGLLIDDGSGWRLCELVLESFPPQCGGESLAVDGLDPTGLPIEESGDVQWQTEATVVGEIDGDTIVVTGSPASS